MKCARVLDRGNYQCSKQRSVNKVKRSATRTPAAAFAVQPENVLIGRSGDSPVRRSQARHQGVVQLVGQGRPNVSELDPLGHQEKTAVMTYNISVIRTLLATLSDDEL